MDGQRLSEAMAAHGDRLTPMICTMVAAGEAGGVLDVIAGRIADGLADGSFGAPADGVRAEARYWRAFGRLLSSGVPILEVFRLVGSDVDGPLADATGAVAETVRTGGDMAAAMRECPQVFAESICATVAEAEGAGELDIAAGRIADALAASDLSALASPSLEGGDASGAAEAYIADLLTGVVDAGGSDVHFDPSPDGGRVRFRVDGVLRETDPPGEGLYERVVSRFKIMCNLDVAERRLPQDGIIFMTLGGKEMDLRVSTAAVASGERVVLRLIVRSLVTLDLARIGFSDADLARVRRLCELPYGIVIANGPTGSGKTTLLYSMLEEINTPERAIITIEDPVEFRIDGIAQMPINPKIGLTYVRGIISALRQAPNVVMIGELRDLESVEMALQTAVTGHLVFTTLHCNDSPSVLRRLLDVGAAPFMVNSAVAGIVSLRLVRRLCEKCRKPAELPPAHSLPPEAARVFADRDDLQLAGPVGCEACGGSGFRGRTCIYEVLEMTEELRQVVADGGDPSALRNAAIAGGMKPLLVNGLEKAAAGLTTIEEVVRVSPR